MIFGCRRRILTSMSVAPSPKPLGWLLALAVGLITFGVICGLVGIAVVAKRKQRYRITDESIPHPTNTTTPPRAP